MTDKERLEKIKFRLTFGSMNLCNAPRLNNFEWPFETVHKEDLAWLIQQVELAQELEESCNIGNCLSKFTNKTETDNKRYQEALEKIKDNSSCVVAFGYAVKALEDSK